MRVLHVINQMERGGAETALAEFIAATADLEHGVVPVLRAGGRDWASLEASGATVFEPPGELRTRRERLRHVWAAARAFRPDVIHTVLFEADLAGRLVAAARRTPVVTSLVNTPYAPQVVRHAGVRPSRLRAVQLVDRLLGRYATTAFHAITEAVADAAVRDLGIARERIAVIPRGRDRRRLGEPSARRRDAARAGLQIDAGAPVVLNVGRQDRQKGQIHLLAAFAQVLRRRPAAVLLLAGRPGNATGDLQRWLAAHPAVADRTRLLGERTDVPDLLCAADVFAFPSLYEGLGGALLEAMALGVPVVASDLPALREVLDDGRCGRLVAVADPAEIAAAIEDVLAAAGRAAGHAEAARARFEEAYRLDAAVAAQRELYRTVVARRGGALARRPRA